MSTFRNDLLENQKVTRRRTQSSPGERTGRREPKDTIVNRDYSRKQPERKAFRPVGIAALNEQNTRIIDKVKQNPVRNPKRKQALPVVQTRRRARKKNNISLNKIISIFRESPASSEPAYEEPRFEKPVFNKPVLNKPRGLFTIILSALPVTALFCIVLGVFAVIYSQNGTFDWVDREVVSTGRDYGSQYNLALYAGIGQAEERDTIPLDMTDTFVWHTYTVKRGDTVSGIALEFSVSMDAIIASNGITNARALRAGETIRIPNMDGIPYTVKSGDTLSGISQTMGVPLEIILDANDLQTDVINAGMSIFIPGARMNRDDLKLALGELFAYPVSGARLSSPFGWRNDPFSGARSHHAGIDLSCPQGTPIRAAMDGTVSAQSTDRIYGNYVILTHSSGYQTLYAHLHTTSVKKGDRVSQGVQIGTVGSTGYSTGPHLHFAIYKNSRAVNPLDLLSPRR